MIEPSKSLAQRIKDKAGDKVAELLVAAVVTVLAAGLVFAKGWVANEWACINKRWCEVQGWSLGALIVVTIVTGGAALYSVFRLYRVRRELRTEREKHAVRAIKTEAPPFRAITVEDQHLGLRWFIRRPPSEWLHLRKLNINVAPSTVHDVLDGPFHAAPGCNAALEEVWRNSGTERSSPTFAERCPSCGEQVFTGRRRPSGHGYYTNTADVWPIRAQALEELQRMERNGTSLDGATVVLENPAYWKVMGPPPPPQ